jgi:hypothetical protein
VKYFRRIPNPSLGSPSANCKKQLTEGAQRLIPKLRMGDARFVHELSHLLRGDIDIEPLKRH